LGKIGTPAGESNSYSDWHRICGGFSRYFERVALRQSGEAGSE
jgi:hypothetical protein